MTGEPATTELAVHRTTRRGFVARGLALGGGAAAVALFGDTATAGAATDSDVIAFGNAAVGAERIAVAFYSNALGLASSFGVSADLAKGTLLNSAHREYFEAARNQEASHLATLLSRFPRPLPTRSACSSPRQPHRSWASSASTAS
jgi:hypothetical protein